MCSQPFDKDSASRIIHCNNQTIRIALDVENYPVRCNYARMRVARFYFRRVIPIRLPRLLEPRVEGGLHGPLVLMSRQLFDKPR